MQEVILIGAAVALVFGMIIWSLVLREQIRTKKLTAVGAGLGLSMVKENTLYRIDTPLFHLGDEGANRFRNAMEGTVAGLQTVFFDLYYEVDRGGDDGKTSAWYTAAAFAFPNREFPTFSITKSGFLSRRARNKVEIEGNPEFSERFVVNGKEQAAIRELLNGALIQTVVSARPSEKLVIEGAGSWLVLYRRGRRVRPEHWKEFLDETSTIASAFVRYGASHQTSGTYRVQVTVSSTLPTQYSQST